MEIIFKMELEKSQVVYKDFTQMCRLCLSTRHLSCIYENPAILKIFQSITDIEVKQDDNLPKNICKDCIKKLEDIEEFANKCIDNNSLLKSIGLPILQNIKQEISSDASFESEPTELQKFKDEVADSMENIIFEVVEEPDLCSETHLSKNIKNEKVEETMSDKLDTKDVFSCKVCDKKFKRLANLENHVHTHNDVSNTCRVCNETFSNVTELPKHNCSLGLNYDMVKNESKFGTHCECIYCNKTFTQIEELIRHTRSHLGGILYKCTVCKKKFTQKSALNRHALLHIGKFQCKICDTPFTRESQLQSHIEKAHNKEGSESHVCKFCGKSYSTKLYLTIHLKNHIKVGAFQCEICDKTFSLKSLLNRHSMSHPEYMKFKCDKCSKGFRSRASYTQHMVWHKLGLTPSNLACDGCGKVYQRPRRLKNHMKVCPKANNSELKPDFLCSTCGQTFPTRRHLLNHARSHRKKRQFQCDICGNKFSYKDSLDQHLNSHKGEKPYKCTYCNKSFQRTSYYRHIRMHKNIREHKCALCDKTFYRTDLLKQHMRSHK